MKKHLLFLLLSCLLTSCATIFNGKKTHVIVYTEKPAKLIYNDDTLYTTAQNGFSAVGINTLRRKHAFEFTIVSDSLERDISIPSKISYVYYFNFYPLFWPGIFIDKGSQKRYTYKSVINLDENLEISPDKKITTAQRKDLIERRNALTRQEQKNHFMTNKGDWYYYLSLPMFYLSYYSISPESFSRVNTGGIFGISTGVDYYYKRNRFFNITGTISAGGDISTCTDGYSDTEKILTYNINGSHNHKYRNFSYGYGLSYTYTHWHKDTYKDLMGNLKENTQKRYSYLYTCEEANYSTLGFVFNGYSYFSKYFSVGIIYKPNFVRLKSKSKPFCFEHQITLDFAFRFNLIKGK